MIGLWEEALNDFRERLSAENFETWLAPLRVAAIEDKTARIFAPHRFHADWVQEHYGRLIQENLQLRSGIVDLRLIVDVDRSLQEKSGQRASSPGSIPAPRPSSPGSIPAPRPSSSRTTSSGSLMAPRVPSSAGFVSAPTSESLPPPTPSEIARTTGLNPRYTFDNFVVGPSNQLAHAAAIAASKTHAKRGNPFFIYGGTGLGKTHLVNAIGHAVLERDPRARVLYLSAERFTNDFISALQNHRMDEFRKRYRDCDVLLMDDIQFLAGREQTQEEFFHTFNALYHADKQIVVTSDVYPQQISEMQERLVSRFQWGLVADIQAPELDTRIAILKRKADEENIVLSDDVALFLAQMVKSNVRELEGSLLRLAIAADLVKRPLDLEYAKSTLRPHSAPQEHAMSVDDIQKAVCNYFNIRLAELKSQRRHRQVAYPRMVAMYLCRQRLGTSFPQIGEAFGGKDHTTVMSAVRKINGLLNQQDPKLTGEIEAIERKLGI